VSSGRRRLLTRRHKALRRCANFDGSDGANPYAGPVEGTDRTYGGGTDGNGTVFKTTTGEALSAIDAGRQFIATAHARRTRIKSPVCSLRLRWGQTQQCGGSTPLSRSFSSAEAAQGLLSRHGGVVESPQSPRIKEQIFRLGKGGGNVPRNGGNPDLRAFFLEVQTSSRESDKRR